MKDLVKYQLLVICISWLIAVVFFDVITAYSIVLGGLSYFFPTLISVYLLLYIKNYPELIPTALVVVEVSKILMIIIIMVISYLACPNIKWMAYVVGLILVSQVGLLIFRKKSYYE